MTTMFEKHYTPEQLAELKRRREALGPEAIEKAQSDWRELIAEVKVEMETGMAPEAEPVLALARRWQALVEAFTRQRFRDDGLAGQGVAARAAAARARARRRCAFRRDDGLHRPGDGGTRGGPARV